ncbi:MAG TPA: hypothetical protein VH590_01455 [Ktedonobacterales bacterium]
MSQSAVLSATISRVHWTARAALYLTCVAGMLPHLLQWFFFVSVPVLYSLFSYAAAYGRVFLPIPTLILSVIALVIARRAAWRRGREFALLGCIMSAILCVYPVLAIFVLCCFHLHIVF